MAIDREECWRPTRTGTLVARRHGGVIGRGVWSALLGLAVIGVPLGAQAPSSSEVEAAIAAGLQEKRSVSLRVGAEAGGAGIVCGASDRSSVCGYTIELQGPIGRVQSAAADAAKRYQPFTLATVTDSLRAPVLTVRATPAPPLLHGRTEYRAAAATHVVLIPIVGRAAQESAAVQPTTAATFPVTWSNLMGGERAGQGVIATFPLEQVPTGDFYVVVITEGKEARYQIRQKHRPFIQ